MERTADRLFQKGYDKMENPNRKALKEQYKNRVLTGGIYRIQCSGDDSYWLRASFDMQGSKNRFMFSKTMEKKDTQTERQFSDDVNTLLELWKEKMMEGEHKCQT